MRGCWAGPVGRGNVAADGRSGRLTPRLAVVNRRQRWKDETHMNLFTEIRSLVLDTLQAMQEAGELPGGLDTANVTVEPPRDAAHGDMATNAAMVLAKPAGMKPRDIAGALAERLSGESWIESAEVAGPGFLNLRLSASVWQGVIHKALAGGDIPPFDCGGVVNCIVNTAWSRGLGCVINSQGIMQSPVVREEAGIPDDQVIQTCVAMGWPDDTFPANAVVSKRKSVDEAAVFRGF